MHAPPANLSSLSARGIGDSDMSSREPQIGCFFSGVKFILFFISGQGQLVEKSGLIISRFCCMGFSFSLLASSQQREEDDTLRVCLFVSPPDIATTAHWMYHRFF